MAKDNVSKLIAKGNCFSVLDDGKFIAVDTFDKRAKGGMSRKYIPNTAANRGAIMRKMGKPEVYPNDYHGRTRFLWF